MFEMSAGGHLPFRTAGQLSGGHPRLQLFGS